MEKRSMMKEPDDIDRALLTRIRQNEGCSIREAIRPFLAEKSETALRDRVRALELKKLIRANRTKKEVLLYAESGING
jgi:hypothetical protein